VTNQTSWDPPTNSPSTKVLPKPSTDLPIGWEELFTDSGEAYLDELALIVTIQILS
jgi:hypothetical protein